jgi:hypothetical protein
MPDVEESFVASVKVDRVRRTLPPGVARGYHAPTPEPTRREIESFRLTVRAQSMEQLKQKINAHLELVDEHDFGDEKVTRGD